MFVHVHIDGELRDQPVCSLLLGRNLFVIAAGEIFETEVQLLSSYAEKKPPSAAGGQ